MINAKYTIVLKTLLDDPQSKALIDKALSTYPLYDPKNEAYYTKILTREELNKKLLDHFKYREIGFETFGRFLDELEIAMNEIMPYYNQLFASEDIINAIEDIFGNIDITETFEEDSEANSEGSETSTITGEDNKTNNTSSESTSQTSDTSTNDSSITSDSKNVKATTPQSELDVIGANIDDVAYADQVDWNKANSTNVASSTGTSNNTSEASANETEKLTKEETANKNNTDSRTTKTSHTLHKKGNQGVNTYAHDMVEFRTLFINIVQKIINDPRIQELFMGIY